MRGRGRRVLAMREQRIRVYRAWAPSLDVGYASGSRWHWAWRVRDERRDVVYGYPTWEDAWQGARRAAAARVRAKGAGDA